MQTVYPEVVHPRPDKNDKLWSILCHLSGPIGLGYFWVPLIIYLVMRRESEFAAHHAREALNFNLSILLYVILSLPMALLIVGIPLILAIGFLAFIVGIIAAVKTSEGELYRYPLSIRFVK